MLKQYKFRFLTALFVPLHCPHSCNCRFPPKVSFQFQNDFPHELKNFQLTSLFLCRTFLIHQKDFEQQMHCSSWPWKIHKLDLLELESRGGGERSAGPGHLKQGDIERVKLQQFKCSNYNLNTDFSYCKPTNTCCIDLIFRNLFYCQH